MKVDKVLFNAKVLLSFVIVMLHLCVGILGIPFVIIHDMIKYKEDFKTTTEGVLSLMEGYVEYLQKVFKYLIEEV